MEFFHNLTIRQKLLVNLVNTAVSLLVLLVLQLWNQQYEAAMHSLLNKTEQLDADVLTLRRNEKDFLARKDLKYQEKFNDNTSLLLNNTKEIEAGLVDAGMPTNEIIAFNKAVSDYKLKFNQLVEEQQKIGLHSKDGLYGELRAAVHEVETLLKANQSDALLADMLQLRRNEKDFMLRRDAKYLDKFVTNVNSFTNEINASDLASQVQSQLTRLVNIYKDKFAQLIEAEKNIGLDHKTGLLGELRETIHQTETLFNKLKKTQEDSLEEKLAFSQIITVSAFIIMAIIVVLLNLLTSKTIISPILSFNRSISNIRDNNDFTIRTESKGNDEIACAAKDFNSLMDDFQSLVAQVNTSLNALDNATRSLQDNSHQSQLDMSEQHLQSDQVATAATELQASFEEVAANTTLALEKAEANSQAADQGQEVVNIAVRDINELSEQLVNSSEVVNNLAEDSHNIGSVLDVIRSIAEQTNLLALNAAIEAARAGEQGRGFAVVADEVRSLAMRTQESTSEISSIIESLQNRTETIVTVMQSCRDKGDDASNQAAQAGETLLSINSGMAEILDMSTQISTAAEEQTSVMASVNESIVSIRDIAHRANELTQENVTMSTSIAEQAKSLKDTVNKYKV